MDTIVIQSEPEKTKAIKEILKAFGVSFTIKKKEKEYNPEFVKMVLEARNSNQRRVLDDEYKKELFGQL